MRMRLQRSFDGQTLAMQGYAGRGGDGRRRVVMSHDCPQSLVGDRGRGDFLLVLGRVVECECVRRVSMDHDRPMPEEPRTQELAAPEPANETTKRANMPTTLRVYMPLP